MRTLLLGSIFALLCITQVHAYQLPASDGPAGAEVYIVTFSEPGALKYEGGTGGLKATAKVLRSKARNKGANPDVRAYRDYLNGVLDDHANQMTAALNRQVQPLLRYNVLRTGMAVLLTAEEAQLVAGMPGVLEVRKDEMYELDTDAGPQWIAADTIWDGSAVPGGAPNFGAGVVVGILDTGVNMDHPSFSATPEDGHTYVNPFGDGVFIGDCDGTFVCNNKLIGVWDFADPFGEADGPEDGDGHGSHTASTVAGNFISGPFLDGEFLAASISGVARHANVITYDVCAGSGCPGAATHAGAEQALLDGVDVVNYSISGGTNPWSGADRDRDFLDLVDNGTVVSASAGNNGPTPGTVAHLGPWVMTVANLTHNRINKNNVSAVGGPMNLQDMWGQLGSENNFGGMDVTDEILWAGDIDAGNFEGCNPWPDGNEFSGAIALISRGSCNFSVKLDNAEAAGAVAVVVFNHLSDIPFSMGGIESASIPSLMIGLSDGEALRDYVMANPGTVVTMEAASQYLIDDALGSWANSGTSRGPNPFHEVTKPDLGGPGTNIFAAFSDLNDPPFAFLTGTSMSSPHAAGSAALMKAVHSDWSPAQIKSAMMMTSRSGLDEFGEPSNPDIEGSGTIDLSLAAQSGLVLNETFDHFLAANPATGGDPATLNLPSMRSNDCNGNCTWYRTVCNALDVETSWTVAVPTAPGYHVFVAPNTFTLGPQGNLLKGGFEDGGARSSCRTLLIDVSITIQQVVDDGVFLFDQITLSEDGAKSPDLKMTLSFLPTGLD